MSNAQQMFDISRYVLRCTRVLMLVMVGIGIVIGIWKQYDINRQAAVAVAQEHGASIIAVSSRGGQAALDMTRAAALKSGTNGNDAAEAYVTLFSRFNSDQHAIERGLDIGADVAKVTGVSLADIVSTLGKDELFGEHDARDRLSQWVVDNNLIGKRDIFHMETNTIVFNADRPLWLRIPCIIMLGLTSGCIVHCILGGIDALFVIAQQSLRSSAHLDQMATIQSRAWEKRNVG